MLCFTATSATCVTGLVVFDTYTQWSIFGQIVILILIQICGLGFVTVEKYVISKSSRDIQTKFLLRNGADEVVDPERNIAEKLAIRCSANHVFDYIELTNDISIYEISTTENWIGKSIKEINFRVKYSVNILATKIGDYLTPLPSADHIFRQEKHLLVVGRHGDVKKILKHIRYKYDKIPL